MSDHVDDAAVKSNNFLRTVIERDIRLGTNDGRCFAGSPGDAEHHSGGRSDAAKVRLRFPPEPNGYLHIGHAKSIGLNFGLARDFGGVCHLRFDDTNPEKEERRFVDAIVDATSWLGWTWQSNGTSHLYFASDYFDFMYRAAEHLIATGRAYVDEQSAEEIRAKRGDFSTPGSDSRFRNRTPDENMARFREMREGKHPDGAMVLRAKIDMASPNINLRDPTLYRIRRASHHKTGDRWCIYPMYAYAHPIEDALERITHSLCTLEFEDQRPFYDWLLDALAEEGLLARPLPKQYEFGRLNLTYVVTSKRKLRRLVEEMHVAGWDDPRMPTLIGMRRRGYTPESIRALVESSGATKQDAWLDYSVLDSFLRADLEGKARRASAVLNPLELRLVNFTEVFGSGTHREPCDAPLYPHAPELGSRHFTLGPQVWIERSDFLEVPTKGYHRLFPGNKVRLKAAYVVECIGCEKDSAGNITAVTARLIPGTKSGTSGAAAIKVKGVITWVGTHEAVAAEIRLYDRLFTEAQPDAEGRDFVEALNPSSLSVVAGWVEPSLSDVPAETHVQFERLGYFVADRHDHQVKGKSVFNRITGLRDTFSR